MRDPVMYRILHEPAHHRTGNKWKIYPMYDWTHGQNDSMEGITHSLCSLEYRDHRPLYDWFHEQLGVFKSRQIEFARLNLNYTVMSKRKLLALVEQGLVRGWSDPRLPTIAGIRRRGYTPEAIRDFCARIGVAKKENVIDMALLEATVREDLNRRAQRALAVLRPLKVVIENYPEGQVEFVEAVNNPEDPSAGARTVPFSRVLYIEHDDFMAVPPKKFFRLSPGREVRLRYAYILKCEQMIADANGIPTELRCAIDPGSLTGPTAARRVKGTIHWVSAAHARDAEVRLYDRLFRSEDPGEGGRDPLTDLNPTSLTVLTECKVESILAGAAPGARFQFERQGYFCADPDSTPGAPVFNRTVTLKDTWAKISGKVEK
jgi:glutaminyl-tRNA synthetase